MKRASKGGMCSPVPHTYYCPVCSKELNSVSYRQLGIYTHIGKKGNILLCDVNNKSKRKKVKSEEVIKRLNQLQDQQDQHELSNNNL